MSDTQQVKFTDSALSDHCKVFFSQFKNENKEYKYVDRIDAMFGSRNTFINIDFEDISTEKEIQKILFGNPERLLIALARAIKETLQVRFPDYAESIKDEIKARIAHFPLQSNFDDINAKTISKMVMISGMVLRASEVRPLTIDAVYTCPDEHPTKVKQPKSMELKMPIVCDNPSCKHRDFEFREDLSTYTDYQVIRMQENTDDGTTTGYRPKIIDVNFKGNLVNTVQPGDKINLTGIGRLVADKITIQKKSAISFHIRLEGNNIEFIEGRNSIIFSEKDEELLETLSKQSDIIQRLVGSFAPHIVGKELEIIKEALLYSIVGSPEIILNDGIRKRGDIHEFLIGDPGGAKSELLKYAAKLSPRGFFTSGEGNTGVGLTAAIVKDKNGMLSLEAGPLVLGDRGLVAIDEFDKMSSDDRGKLHGAMEQQQIPIAKGGIIATLNSRTTIIAAANPVNGKWNKFEPLYKNVDIPIALLTRFDLIFIVTDPPNEEKDRMKASHVIGIYNTKQIKIDLELDMFTKYILYAKRTKVERIDVEGVEKIINNYVKTRSSVDENQITITLRQLEAVVRISTARAKLRKSSIVEEEDVDRAIFLLEESYKQVGVDPETGKVDMGRIEGHSKQDIALENLWLDLLKTFDGSYEMPIVELVDKMIETGKWDDITVKKWLSMKFNKAVISTTKPGYFRIE